MKNAIKIGNGITAIVANLGRGNDIIRIKEVFMGEENQVVLHIEELRHIVKEVEKMIKK